MSLKAVENGISGRFGEKSSIAHSPHRRASNQCSVLSGHIISLSPAVSLLQDLGSKLASLALINSSPQE